MKQGLVVGLDLSLNSTGICFSLPNTDPYYFTFVPKSIKLKKGMKMQWINRFNRLIEYDELFRNKAYRGFRLSDAELVVLEDYAYATKKSKSLTGFGEQRGVLYKLLADKEMADRFVTISPGGLKKFAVGTGRMDKEIFVQKVALKFGQVFDSSDECDSFVLTEIGKAVLAWKAFPARGQWTTRPRIFQPEHLVRYQAESILNSEMLRGYLGVNKLGGLRE